MLRNVKSGYNFGNDNATVSKLLLKDNLKLYGKKTLVHLFSGCDKLARQEYKLWRYGKVTMVIHLELCNRHNFQTAETWYAH